MGLRGGGVTLLHFIYFIITIFFNLKALVYSAIYIQRSRDLHPEIQQQLSTVEET